MAHQYLPKIFQTAPPSYYIFIVRYLRPETAIWKGLRVPEFKVDNK